MMNTQGNCDHLKLSCQLQLLSDERKIPGPGGCINHDEIKYRVKLFQMLNMHISQADFSVFLTPRETRVLIWT